MQIQKGDVFTYDATPGFMISPRQYMKRVKVVWNDGENIHYVTEHDRHNIKQTPIDRFISIIQ